MLALLLSIFQESKFESRVLGKMHQQHIEVTFKLLAMDLLVKNLTA
jgi:hypothetical protein